LELTHFLGTVSCAFLFSAREIELYQSLEKKSTRDFRKSTRDFKNSTRDFRKSTRLFNL